jgi:D-alanyl-lipoteichoic acid acyltransferase DltB (MBOAT superfamily)
MVTSYLLYLRISGQFHIIIGILCLFGFNLSETHHLYYLSAGFNDFWRRINIYWKDLMIKMIYYPVFLRLRKQFGMTAAIICATVAVFLGTWILHSYQWFWLRNAFPIAVNDGLFWGFLGVMVIINSFAEARSRSQLQKTLTFHGALTVAFKTVGFFALMCVLWSLWSSASPGEWLAIVSQAGRSGVGDFVMFGVLLAALVGVGVLLQFTLQRWGRVGSSGGRSWFVSSPARTG